MLFGRAYAGQSEPHAVTMIASCPPVRFNGHVPPERVYKKKQCWNSQQLINWMHCILKVQSKRIVTSRTLHSFTPTAQQFRSTDTCLHTVFCAHPNIGWWVDGGAYPPRAKMKVRPRLSSSTKTWENVRHDEALSMRQCWWRVWFILPLENLKIKKQNTWSAFMESRWIRGSTATRLSIGPASNYFLAHFQNPLAAPS